MKICLNTFLAFGFISTLPFSAVWAEKPQKKATEHRQHVAHTHGAGKMSIAFDGLNGRIEFEVAAESILGFEYTPKTNRDKKVVADAIKSFQKDFDQMLQFDSALGCVFSPEKVEQKMEGKTSSHSDFIATYTVQCKKSLMNSQVKFKFSRFEHLNDVDVTFLIDAFQKTIEITNKESVLDLK